MMRKFGCANLSLLPEREKDRMRVPNLLLFLILNCGMISFLRAENDPGGGHPQLPYAALTNVANGDILPSHFIINASATPSVASATIANMGFYIDGGMWGSAVTGPPYSFEVYLN